MERQPFNEWLAKHARGTLNSEATVALAEVVGAVAANGKGGKLVLEITIEPAGSSGRSVAIGGRVVMKNPQPAPELSVFYVGDGGSLHRDDPYQTKLGTEDVRSVQQEQGEPRRLDEPAQGQEG